MDRERRKNRPLQGGYTHIPRRPEFSKWNRALGYLSVRLRRHYEWVKQRAKWNKKS